MTSTSQSYIAKRRKSSDPAHGTRAEWVVPLALTLNTQGPT
jgi:hypothetical protein